VIATDTSGIAERNMYIRECRLRLFSDLGAFVKNGQLVYWRANDKRVARQVRDRRPLVVRAGYMDRERGRHWKRRILPRRTRRGTKGFEI